MEIIARLFIGVILFAGLGMTASAQVAVASVDRTADHNALRAILVDAERAVNEGRFNDVVQYLDPNVNIIYQNAEVADGIEEAKAFQEKIFNKNGGVLKGIRTKISAEKLSEFYGDTATAYGTSLDHYSFVGGLEMDLTSKWSATLVKENGLWKVVSLQFTSNLFDNPILTSAKTSAKYFGGGGLFTGLILGFFGARFSRRKQ